MVTYRTATAADATSIAQLHSLSWQQTYRGIWSDDFLNGPVFDDRQQLWETRFHKPNLGQYVVVAQEGPDVCGFACTYASYDPTWGTLLDNLHVRDTQKGRGVGTALLKTVARWACQAAPETGFYLWVLTLNQPARNFYEHLGAINQEQIALKGPDGYDSDCNRYVWDRPSKLV